MPGRLRQRPGQVDSLIGVGPTALEGSDEEGDRLLMELGTPERDRCSPQDIPLQVGGLRECGF